MVGASRRVEDGVLRRALRHRGGERALDLVVAIEHQRFLGREVLHQRRRRHVGRVGDLAHGDRVEPAREEQPQRGVAQREAGRGLLALPASGRWLGRRHVAQHIKWLNDIKSVTIALFVRASYSRGVTHDVVIAGAGPVGLFLACELRLGEAVAHSLVLEQQEWIERAPEASSVSRSACEGCGARASTRARSTMARTDRRDQRIAPRGCRRARRRPAGDPEPRPNHHGADRPATSRASASIDRNIDSSQWTYRSAPGPADTQLGTRHGAPSSACCSPAHAISVGVEIRRGQGRRRLLRGFRRRRHRACRRGARPARAGSSVATTAAAAPCASKPASTSS